MTGSAWDKHAEWWQREFTAGVDLEYVEQIIPLALRHLDGARRVLDVGTGEGQVARALHDGIGADLVGVDPTKSLLDLALQRGGGPQYLRGVSEALPLPDRSVDGVVVCLVFEHVDDLAGSLAEVARVLQPGGRFVLFLNHPLVQTPGSALIVDHMVEPAETYWRLGPYLPTSADVEEVQKDVFVRFVHRPLSTYVNLMSDVGLDLTGMEEPAPPDGFLADSGEVERALVAATPRLLVLSARRRDLTSDPAGP